MFIIIIPDSVNIYNDRLCDLVIMFDVCYIIINKDN